MKTFFIILLFSLNLFAQETLPTFRGSGSYVYDVTTGTYQIVNGDLWLYGNFTKTLTDTGTYSFRPYIVWKYTGGSYDSSIALRIGNSFLIRVLDPTLDATGTYYTSVKYKTKNGNWIYDRGVDSNFTTPVTIVPPDTVPVQFAIHDTTNTEFNTLIESYGTRLTGLDSAWFYAGGQSFKINGGAWRTAAIKVYDEDIFYLRNTSSGVCTTAVNTTATCGGISDVFSITTKLDNTPNAWAFTDVTGAEVSTLYTSDQKTVSGIYCNAPISIGAGQFQINSNAWRSSSTTIANGNTYRVRFTSPSSYNAKDSVTLNIGGVTDVYSVTTRADTTPAQFTFIDITNAHPDSSHISNGIVFTSLDSCYATAGLDTFKIGVNGSWFVGIKKVYGNDTAYVKGLSLGYSGIKNITLMAGGVSDTWTISTMNDPTALVRYFSQEGNNTTGTSWATAWTSMNASKWSQLAGGNSYLLFDGGTDSVVYNIEIDPTADGSWGNYIYVMPAKFYPGYQPDSVKGKVIIDHNYAGTSRSMIEVSGTGNDWLYFKGFIGRNIEYRALYVGAGGAASHIVFDSIEVWGVNNDDPIDIMGARTNANLQDSTIIPHHIELKYCKIITNDNRSNPQEEDVAYLDCAGDIWIHHCIFWERNNHNCSSGDCPHVDNIQCAYGVYGLKVYNNIFIKDSCVSGANMITGIKSRYADYGDTTVIYNNYMYTGGMYNCGSNWTQQILWRAPETVGADNVALVYSINNTLVASNGASGNSCAEGHYNPLESNNIFAQMGVNGNIPTDGILPQEMAQWYSTYSVGDLKYVDSMHTNLMYQKWGNVSFGGNRWRYGSTTGSITDSYTDDGWALWLSKGGDGVNDDPEFVNNYRWYDTAPYELSATSPAINAGTDMSYVLLHFEAYLPEFFANKDIKGNPIVGARDIGCFEHQGE